MELQISHHVSIVFIFSLSSVSLITLNYFQLIKSYILCLCLFPFSLSFTQIPDNNEITMKLLTKKVMKEGKAYMQIEKSRLTYTTDRVAFDFTNLFNGNKALSETTNRFFNENWKEIHNELRPRLFEAIATMYESLLNKVFGTIPYDELFI
jgi:Haemolymph juvenile hormone binding protein (JHBP)